MNGYRGGFGGGFGGANLNQLMKQAQKMQEDMLKAKEELENTEFSAKSGGGMVEVVMLGNKHIKKITVTTVTDILLWFLTLKGNAFDCFFLSDI